MKSAHSNYGKTVFFQKNLKSQPNPYESALPFFIPKSIRIYQKLVYSAYKLENVNKNLVKELKIVEFLTKIRRF
jgi:hypothetical protein